MHRNALSGSAVGRSTQTGTLEKSRSKRTSNCVHADGSLVELLQVLLPCAEQGALDLEGLPTAVRQADESTVPGAQLTAR